jgi:hypothetical protein
MGILYPSKHDKRTKDLQRGQSDNSTNKTDEFIERMHLLITKSAENAQKRVKTANSLAEREKVEWFGAFTPPIEPYNRVDETDPNQAFKSKRRENRHATTKEEELDLIQHTGDPAWFPEEDG